MSYVDRQAGRQAGVTTLAVSFRNFANPLKNAMFVKVVYL